MALVLGPATTFLYADGGLSDPTHPGADEAEEVVIPTLATDLGQPAPAEDSPRSQPHPAPPHRLNIQGSVEESLLAAQPVALSPGPGSGPQSQSQPWGLMGVSALPA
jgi:hypothetical protein